MTAASKAFRRFHILQLSLFDRMEGTAADCRHRTSESKNTFFIIAYGRVMPSRGTNHKQRYPAVYISEGPNTPLEKSRRKGMVFRWSFKRKLA